MARKRKKRRSPAQKRALKKMLAARRKSLRGKGRKAPRRKKRGGWRRHKGGGVASHYHSGSRGYASGAAASQGVASHYHSGSRGLASHYGKSARKKTRRSKKHGGAVTAASILRGARARGKKLWVCSGPKRSGCGGGKKGRRGARVVGILR